MQCTNKLLAVECEKTQTETTCSTPTRQYAGNDQNLARFLRSEKQLSIENMLTEGNYKNWLSEVSVLDFKQFRNCEIKSLELSKDQNIEKPNQSKLKNFRVKLLVK